MVNFIVNFNTMFAGFTLQKRHDHQILQVIIRHDMHNPTFRLQYTELATAHESDQWTIGRTSR